MKLKEEDYMNDLKDEAVWIGEDGDMAVNCKTKLGALRKFKALMKQDVGEIEAKQVKIEAIGIGWLHLPPKGRKIEADYVISFSEPSPYEVFVWQE